MSPVLIFQPSASEMSFLELFKEVYPSAISIDITRFLFPYRLDDMAPSSLSNNDEIPF